MQSVLKWHYTAGLLLVYLGVFHAWMRLDRTGVIASAVVVSAALAGWLWRENRRGYFVNAWDRFAHAVVIADILIEGLFIRVHDTLGFYFCALAFAVVIAAYRVFAARRQAANTQG